MQEKKNRLKKKDGQASVEGSSIFVTYDNDLRRRVDYIGQSIFCT